MSTKVQLTASRPKRCRLVKIENSYFVPVSHQELDNLIGRLMQMCDLMSDPEQRKALKDEIKQRTRAWLDDTYSSYGYDKFEGVRDYAEITEVK